MDFGKEIKGELDGDGLRIAIVVARFNQFITRMLLTGVWDGLRDHGVRDEDTLLSWVPGCFELPVTAKALAQTGRYHSVICLGAVIRGETGHYEMVANQASFGIGRAALDTGVPIIFGVLTTDDIDQAINRAGGKFGNLGYDAALSAVEMGRLMANIKGLQEG